MASATSPVWRGGAGAGGWDAGRVDDLTDRIHGGLAGAVVGDALGSLTETLSIRRIRELYGWLDDFTEFRFRPFGQERVVGAWTDDSSLVVAMARSVVEAGGVDLDAAVAHLMRWADDPSVAQFSGPSTSSAVARLRAGADPREVGRGEDGSATGASNGGGMKAAPAGWAHPGDVEAAARAAAVLCTPTHNTQVAISGAAAVAAAVARACVPGTTVDDVVDAAVEGALVGERVGLEQGREVAAPSIARRIRWAVEAARGADDLPAAVQEVADRIGAGLATHESVPAVFGLLAATDGDVNRTAVAAANVGDDTDTVGTMACAIAGTLGGIGAVDPAWYARVREVNGLHGDADLATLAAGLAAVATHRA